MLICSEELYKESQSTEDLTGTRIGANLETKGCILPIIGRDGRISLCGVVVMRNKVET